MVMTTHVRWIFLLQVGVVLRTCVVLQCDVVSCNALSVGVYAQCFTKIQFMNIYCNTTDLLEHDFLLMKLSHRFTWIYMPGLCWRAQSPDSLAVGLCCQNAPIICQESLAPRLLCCAEHVRAFLKINKCFKRLTIKIDAQNVSSVLKQ